MDSTNGTYMSYGNNNNVDDLSSFFEGAQAYASTSEPFDSALFEEAYPSQSLPSAQQSTFNQAQRQTQSQSPALPQFKPTQNTYAPHQYGQNVYNPQAMSQQGFDQHLLSRPSHSPAPFDQYAYQQSMAYPQQSFNYAYNSFNPTRQQTPTQAFRPQVNGQTPGYMNAARPPQTQAHVSQVQGSNGISYPYQQSQRFVAPGMLSNEHSLYQNAPNMTGSRQMNASPYMPTMGDRTINPSNIPMQNNQVQPPPRSQSVNMESVNGVAPQHLHSMLPGAGPAPVMVQAADKVLKPMPKTAGKSGGSMSSSDDDLEIEGEDDPEVRPAIITIAKPAGDNYRDRLLWEVVDSVWSPRNRPAPTEKIIAAIKFVAEAVRGLREHWKSQNEKLKKAELPNSETSAHAPALKQMVGQYRELMETLATRVTKWGHPSILKRLGENELLLSALYSFLLDRFTAEDYNSTLITSILLLGTKLHTVDEDKLERVKWTKILSRIIKKATNDSKSFGQQILVNAKKVTAKKKAEAAAQGPASPAGSSSGQVAGVKRARDGSEAAQQAPKKVNVKPASKPLSVQLEEQRRLKEKEKEKARLTAAKETKSDKSKVGATAATVSARPKVAAPPPKASPFASLLSASKKPGTTNAERMAVKPKVEPAPVITVQNAAPVKRDVKPQASAPPAKVSTPAPSSSFLGFIADMDKPKEAPKSRIEEIPNETAEARAKRLRKESRKRLRVSWKADSDLVETRIFEHDPDEETGHEDSMMRDAGDTAKEGEMLKRHRADAEDVDEDDDDEIDFYTPHEIDFSEMKDDGNFTKTGGLEVPDSASREAHNKYESGRMMTVFASGERPNTPKEPPSDDTEDDDFTPVADIGYPTQPFVREREQAVLAHRQAYQQPAQSNGFNLASALANFQPPQPTQAQPSDWLRSLTQQVQPQIQPQQSALAGIDISKLLAAVNQTTQPTYQPPAPQSTPALDPSVAAYLASFSQQGQAALPVGSSSNPNPWPGTGEDQDKNGKRKAKGTVPLDQNGLPVNYKTQVCSFWEKGQCTKGDSCTYRHDHNG